MDAFYHLRSEAMFRAKGPGPTPALRSRFDSPPRRIDFAILVVTHDEFSAVQTILNLPHKSAQDRMHYNWGYIGTPGSYASVVLLSCSDKQGRLHAAQKTTRLINTFNPGHILLVGHGLGLRRQPQELRSGDVVLSCDNIVTGTLDSSPL